MPNSREKRDEYNRRYYRENREHLRSRGREYYRAHKQDVNERVLRWHRAHSDQTVEYQRRYRDENHERLRARKREYYREHRQREQGRSRDWRLAHGEQVVQYRRRYAAAKMDHLREYRNTYYEANREQILKSRRRASRPPGGKRLHSRVAYIFQHPEEYIWEALGIELRPYQSEPLARILDSIQNHRGDTFILMFPRQSGKDELLLDLILYLADLYSPTPAGIIVVNPTYKPQTETALQRFDASLEANNLTRGEWQTHAGFIRMIGRISPFFPASQTPM